ncbi:hypothetical protein ACQ86G_19355 [Roseateles chitinivorans]|uniref:hypothetical protein n=1 Tax=Roseateles chitinivorans TaxID=2917965 RepID=UPI003D66473A
MAWQRLIRSAIDRPATFVVRCLRWIGIAGFFWILGQWLVEQAGILVQDRDCTSTVADRIVLPNPTRAVEARIHRCTNAFQRRPRLRWDAWAISTEPGKAGRRLLISLEYRENAAPRLRLDAASHAVIDRFRVADILDWEQGRGEGLVPTDFLFIDDEGVERRLP